MVLRRRAFNIIVWFKKFFIFEPNYKHIELSDLILILSVISEILPVIFYLTFQKRLGDKSLRVIFFLLVIGFLNDAYGVYLYFNQIGNFLNYNLFLLVETTCIFLFFYQIFQSLYARKTVIMLLAIYFLLWLSFLIKFGTKGYMNTCITFENISILVACIYYYYEQIAESNLHYIYTEPRFWVVTAYLINTAGTFFLFLYIAKLNTIEQESYYVLNYAFTIIRTFLLSVAMFMQPNKQYSNRNF